MLTLDQVRGNKVFFFAEESQEDPTRPTFIARRSGQLIEWAPGIFIVPVRVHIPAYPAWRPAGTFLIGPGDAHLRGGMLPYGKRWKGYDSSSSSFKSWCLPEHWAVELQLFNGV